MRKILYLRRVEEYLKHCQRRRLSPMTINNYRHVLLRSYRILKKENLLTDPKKLGEIEIDKILEGFKNEPSTVACFKPFLSYLENPIFKRMGIRLKRQRTKVDWLSMEQMEIVKLNAINPLEKISVHLLSELGMRPIETIRLRTQDLKLNTIDILGKGLKWRTIPRHPCTDSVVLAYLDERDILIDKARRKNRHLTIPPNLLIYLRKGTLYPYITTMSIYKAIKSISKRIGIAFSPYTLRRTFGRSVFEALEKMSPSADIRLKRIANLMGHESVDVTMKYLGIELDEMQDTMKKYHEYQKQLLVYQKEKSK